MLVQPPQLRLGYLHTALCVQCRGMTAWHVCLISCTSDCLLQRQAHTRLLKRADGLVLEATAGSWATACAMCRLSAASALGTEEVLAPGTRVYTGACQRWHKP